MSRNVQGPELRIGRRVILDSAFHYPDDPQRSIARAVEAGCHYRFIECEVEDVDVIRQRIAGRPRH